jgi:hypothetical protein
LNQKVPDKIATMTTTAATAIPIMNALLLVTAGFADCVGFDVELVVVEERVEVCFVDVEGIAVCVCIDPESEIAV